MADDDVLEIGGIQHRFNEDGMLERRYVESGDPRFFAACYTSVAPEDADAYAAFVRRHRRQPSRPARDGETLSDEPTDAQLIDRLESALLAAKAADTTQDADEWYYLADTYSEQLADRLAALRAELVEARAELKQWDELRRAAAECIGQDPATWPEHGNAPLAIASALALRQLKLGGRLGANLESDNG